MPEPEPSRVPLFLDVRGRDVLVVGGGPVGASKARSFAASGARVRLVARAMSDDALALSREHASVTLERRAFAPEDVDAAFLVVSATNDAAAQRAIFEAAEAQRRFVLAVDDPSNGSAFGASLLVRPPFTIAISSGGEAPGLLRLLRTVLERALPPESWVARARQLRKQWKAEQKQMGSRFPELVRELLALGEDDLG